MGKGNCAFIPCLSFTLIFIFILMNTKETNNLFYHELQKLLSEKKRILKSDIAAYTPLLEKVLHSSGKGIRPLIMLVFSSKNNKPAIDSTFYAACLEILHLASLIQDDVLDEAEIRRGDPAFYKMLGKKNAILTGDFFCVRIFREIEKRGNYPVLREFLAYSNELVEGEIEEGMSLTSTGLSEADYLRIIEKKTGSLFVVAAAVGSHLSGCNNEQVELARKFGAKFGTAFQIVDDVSDIVNREEASGKTPFTDIRNNVMTLPTIHFVRNHGNYDRLKSLISEGLYDEAVMLLNKHDSIDYAVTCAHQNMAEAINGIQGGFPNDTVKELSMIGENLFLKISEGVLHGI